MEFASKEEMLAYEKAREDYYMKFINAGVCKLYALLFKKIFIPKYRKLKKEYDGYLGGWYRDEKGFIHSKYIFCVDLDKVKNGDICIEHHGNCYSCYIFENDTWHMITI